MRDSGENAENSGRARLVARFGPFTLDVDQRRLARGPVALHLTPKAFDLLQLLVREAPRVVAKRELHERLWPDTFVTDASLAELVKEIRRVLDDRDRAAPVIRTAHRVGYALGPEVRHVAPAPVSIRHWLVFRGRREALDEGENIIGRDPGADVCLGAANVSRRHARITIDGQDARIEDLGSKNGTTIGESPVLDATPLQDGDRLGFGGICAVYRGSTAAMTTETHIEPGRSTAGRPGRTASARDNSRARLRNSPA